MTSSAAHSGNNAEHLVTFKSSRFKELTVSRSSIIEFPTGLFGFKDKREFVFLKYKEPFFWLHSIKDPNLMFLVLNGDFLGPSYQVEAPFLEAAIELKEESLFSVFLLVTIDESPERSTLNLRAPIVVNHQDCNAAQVILHDEKLSTKEPLWPYLQCIGKITE